MNKILRFKVNAVRTLTSPYRKGDEDEATFETMYYLLANMRNLPDDIPLDVNPRVPKMGTNVARRLINAVIEPETDFYINNRGIVIAAKSFSFNSADSEVTIDIGNQDDENDKYSYGILDGGHTYMAIIQNRDKIPADIEKYVRIEVITNVTNITRLSDARNTSVQVSDIALFNLEDSFGDVRNAIADQPYADQIAYKDNEAKPINVAELLRLMFAFDIKKYPDDKNAPIQSYAGKAQVFKRYKEVFDTPFYRSLTKQLPLLVTLYDRIEKEIGIKYNEYKKNLGFSQPHFGNVTGVEYVENSTDTSFLHEPSSYIVSSGYLYPIFGAFRSLLRFDDDTGEVSWIFNPLDVWDKVGADLAQNTFETRRNPQLAGKDKQLWLTNYRIVETQSLRMLLQQNR